MLLSFFSFLSFPPFLSRDKTVVGEVLCNDLNRTRHVHLIGPDVDFGVCGRLVGCRDTCKVLDLTRPRLFVQALGVPLLDDGERRVDEDLDEGDGGGVFFVQLPGELSVRDVWGDEGREGDGGGEGKEEGDLADSSNVFHSRRLVKAEVLERVPFSTHPFLFHLFRRGDTTYLVETESDVITVQPVCMEFFMEQVLFKRSRDGGLFFPRVLALIWEQGDKTCLAGSAQTGEPDGAALLAEKGISLVLGDSSYVRG